MRIVYLSPFDKNTLSLIPVKRQGTSIDNIGIM